MVVVLPLVRRVELGLWGDVREMREVREGNLMPTYRDRVDQITRLSDWSRAVIDGWEALAEDADNAIDGLVERLDRQIQEVHALRVEQRADVDRWNAANIEAQTRLEQAYAELAEKDRQIVALQLQLTERVK